MYRRIRYPRDRVSDDGDAVRKLEETVAALNQKIDRVTFEASAQIEQLKARVAALEGKMK